MTTTAEAEETGASWEATSSSRDPTRNSAETSPTATSAETRGVTANWSDVDDVAPASATNAFVQPHRPAASTATVNAPPSKQRRKCGRNIRV